MAKVIDVINRVFGKYTVKARIRHKGEIKYKVICQCGKEKLLKIWDIKNNVYGCRSCRSKMKKKNTKMKHTIFLLVAAILLASCAQQRYCQPPKGSRDYAVQQWIKQESDGYFTVTTIHGLRTRTVYRYECRPDSVELNRLKAEKPI